MFCLPDLSLLKLDQQFLFMYSKTCVKQPPKGSTKRGCFKSNFNSPNFFVVVIIHTNHIKNELACTYVILSCVFLRTHNSQISFYVKLFFLFRILVQNLIRSVGLPCIQFLSTDRPFLWQSVRGMFLLNFGFCWLAWKPLFGLING